jgi:phosphoglucosamine mutase
VQHLVNSVPNRLDSLKVVVDCSHGAAYLVAPEALRAAGAEVIAIGAEPDGLNINDGYGSGNLDRLQLAVQEHGADAGIAHDGDADRCLAVDANGEPVDGDQILAVLALAMQEAGRLPQDTAVATVMSNLGFRLAMARQGVTVVETGVGDRYVLEAMKAGGFGLGGEQSGHVIMLDHATTGDGTLTALQLMARVAATGKPLAELAAVMDRLPQVLLNVRGVDRAGVEACAPLQEAVRAAEAELGETGRVLLRPSGTAPLGRVMVEAPDKAQADAVAARLAAVVKAELAI